MADLLDLPELEDSPQLADAYDELSLWSAPFGLFLLQHLPLRRGMRVLDLGCGTGFPLLELAQRLGRTCFAVGVDPWSNAMRRAERKRSTHRIENAAVVLGDGARLPLAEGSLDLVVSNLGLNNFSDPDAVAAECARALKRGGILALTTNLRGHWEELYRAFEGALEALERPSLLPALRAHVDHRWTVDSTLRLLERHGFAPRRSIEDRFPMRFLDGSSFLRHSFIRLAFFGAWKSFVPREDAPAVFSRLEQELDAIAERAGALELTVPMAYLELERR
jgi:arsenite methyltransferase